MHVATDSIVGLAAAARALDASDLHLVTGLAPAVRVSREIVMLKAAALEAARLREMVDALLSEAQRSQLERTRELCFSITDSAAGRLRIAVYFHAGVPEVSVRLCAREVPSAKTLGLPPVVEELARKPNGLALIAGPTGSGKTTTLSYMVDLVNRERRAKIVTIEDPVEYVHRPQRSIVVRQEVGTDTLSFPRALVHVLRQNPDVIAIGEMRELEAISTALTAAETGHLVLATLHTPNTAQTVERITGVFPPGQQEQVVLQLGNSLQGIITQMLVPRADKTGVILAYEVLIATPAVRNLIRENQIHMLQTVVETGRQFGMVSMDQCLHDLYKKGVITFDAAASRARNTERFTRKPKEAGAGIA
jgi:twitching motility protein PilT